MIEKSNNNGKGTQRSPYAISLEKILAATADENKKLNNTTVQMRKKIEDLCETIDKLERELAYVGVDVWNRDKTIKHTDDLVAELRKENDDLQGRSGDYLSLLDIRDKRIANLELTILKRDERIGQLEIRNKKLAENKVYRRQ